MEQFLKDSCQHQCSSRDGGKSDNFSKDYVVVFGSLLQGNLNDSVMSSVGGIEPHDFLIDSGTTCSVVDKSTWEWLKSKQIYASM